MTLDYLKDAKEPWVKMRTLIDLHGSDLQDPKVISLRKETLEDSLIKTLIEELQAWPGTVLKSHKSAGQLYHKLSFLAEIGLTAQDDGISFVLDQLMSHKSEEGLFTLPTDIPVHFGGSGETKWSWALCDAPILVYCLAKLGYKDHPEVLKARDVLLGMIEKQGWPCRVAPIMKWRGPGKKEDPCPYVNLIMLKLMSVYTEDLDRPETRKGCETLLHLWEDSMNQHPYMFYMGTDFRKLKVPFIWYDLMHVTDVLSNYSFIHHDPRFLQMVDLIHSKADDHQRYTPKSEWMAWKENEFATKKQVSSWLTFLVTRIDDRITQSKS
jgi:hypothetical protein